MRFIGNNDRLFESLDFDNGKSLQLRSAIGHIDDFALQEIVSVKFIEDLTRIGDVDVIDLKIDPSVSHISDSCRERR